MVRRLPALLLTVSVACSSPTFVMDRDVLLIVQDTRASATSQGEIHVALVVSLANHGSRPVSYIGRCGPASLSRSGGDTLLVGPVACVATLLALEIGPGETLVDTMDFSRPRETWGEPVSGEYALRLGLFGPGPSTAEPVTSAPFRIDLEQDAELHETDGSE